MRIRAEFELLPCLCGFTLFHVIPQPSQRRAPAGVVTFGLIGMSYKTRVTDSHQRSRTHTMRAALMQSVHITGLQLPAHHGLEIADEVGDPRVYEQTRWIYFQILAFQMKPVAVAGYALVRPLAADAQVRARVNYAERCHAGSGWICRSHSPPLCPLFGIGDGFEDASGRSGNENFRHDCVVIWSDACGCHSVSRDDSFAFSGLWLAPRKGAATKPNHPYFFA